MSYTIEELNKRLGVFERKAAREKKARLLAEQQLEKYSREIYETNQSLQASLASSKKKQANLEFLGKSSEGVMSTLTSKELILNMVELTGNFFLTECGFYIVTDAGLPENSDDIPIWFKESGWSFDKELLHAAMECLPLVQDGTYPSWLVSPIDSEKSKRLAGFNWIIYVNFELRHGQKGWITFLSRATFIDQESLFVLNTSNRHLLIGIRRASSDVRILEKTDQLKDSLSRLEAAQSQLMQSEKMAALGQLAAGVAHEINNPISFIRSNMEMLLDYLQVYNELQQNIRHHLSVSGPLNMQMFEQLRRNGDIDYIEKETFDLLQSNVGGIDRIRDIVDSLKTFSHSGDREFCEMSIVSCIEGALKIARNALKYQHKVENKLTHSLPFIIGNTGQLQQVFVNLFVNAAHAMENGGLLSITSKQNADSLTILVSDTGMGMNKSTIGQLFTPFFTTKPVGIGTGLGLSVSYGIIDAHNAKINVSSEEGVGTTFEICFATLPSHHD
ncbi:MAG: two-component system NtrC family sensor kinase [Paraglaciecola sp.]